MKYMVHNILFLISLILFTQTSYSLFTLKEQLMERKELAKVQSENNKKNEIY